MAALRSAVATSAIPVTITADDTARLPAAVEAALYFCCMEAVQNAAKHSGAQHAVAVRLSDDSGGWRLVVTDDGDGFDPAGSRAGGSGLANMRDRLDAVGGTVTVTSRAGHRDDGHRSDVPGRRIDRSGGLTCAPASPGRCSA